VQKFQLNFSKNGKLILTICQKDHKVRKEDNDLKDLLELMENLFHSVMRPLLHDVVKSLILIIK
jgi:hypothetical protein